MTTKAATGAAALAAKPARKRRKHPEKNHFSKHRPDCPCRPCKAKRGEKDGKGMRKCVYMLPDDLNEALHAAASASGVSQGHIVREAIRDYLDRANRDNARARRTQTLSAVMGD